MKARNRIRKRFIDYTCTINAEQQHQQARSPQTEPYNQCVNTVRVSCGCYHTQSSEDTYGQDARASSVHRLPRTSPQSAIGYSRTSSDHGSSGHRYWPIRPSRSTALRSWWGGGVRPPPAPRLRPSRSVGGSRAARSRTPPPPLAGTRRQQAAPRHAERRARRPPIPWCQ